MIMLAFDRRTYHDYDNEPYSFNIKITYKDISLLYYLLFILFFLFVCIEKIYIT